MIGGRRGNKRSGLPSGRSDLWRFGHNDGVGVVTVRAGSAGSLVQFILGQFGCSDVRQFFFKIFFHDSKVFIRLLFKIYGFLALGRLIVGVLLEPVDYPTD